MFIIYLFITITITITTVLLLLLLLLFTSFDIYFFISLNNDCRFCNLLIINNIIKICRLHFFATVHIRGQGSRFDRDCPNLLQLYEEAAPVQTSVQ